MVFNFFLSEGTTPVRLTCIISFLFWKLVFLFLRAIAAKVSKRVNFFLLFVRLLRLGSINVWHWLCLFNLGSSWSVKVSEVVFLLLLFFCRLHRVLAFLVTKRTIIILVSRFLAFGLFAIQML